MTRIEKSQNLGRLIRQDELSQLGVSTWTKIKEAIKAGKTQEALDLVDYLKIEGRRIHEVQCDNIWALETAIANTLGEEALYQTLRQIGEANYRGLSKLTTQEYVCLRAESERAERSGPNESGNITIVEEKDQYLLYLDPCGTGGRMRREGKMNPPHNFGTTKKAYPWSWGKVGVPYYCLHCCIFSEILPIEWNGYPQRITGYPDNPNDPCVFHVYKKPELIPEEYFTRIGKTKTVK